MEGAKHDDGGPAFPRQIAQVHNREMFEAGELKGQTGMSLRDYFAGQALAGLTVEVAEQQPIRSCNPREIEDIQRKYAAALAASAYRLAEAMLAVRKIGGVS